MNLLQISALMDKFEKQFETLDVQTAHIEETMGNTTTLATPQVTGGAVALFTRRTYFIMRMMMMV